jgi:hypothetical protein
MLTVAPGKVAESGRLLTTRLPIVVAESTGMGKLPVLARLVAPLSESDDESSEVSEAVSRKDEYNDEGTTVPVSRVVEGESVPYNVLLVLVLDRVVEDSAPEASVGLSSADT